LKLVVLVGKEKSNIKQLKEFIPEGYTVFESSTENDLLSLITGTSMGVVLVDLTFPNASSMAEKAYKLKPELSYIGVTKEELINDSSSLYYDYLCPPYTNSKVTNLLERAWERSQLWQELRSIKDKPSGKEAFVPTGSNSDFPGWKKHVLYDFAKSMANNFNSEKLLELFMNAVIELVPTGKISILLCKDQLDYYTVCAQKGLDPSFCSQLRFYSSRGLISWLLKESRILLYSAETTSSAGEALQEMELLQASVSIPLSAHGQLVGALNLGPKITGSLFYEEELELLFFLSGNLAMALHDIDLHHQVRYQKSYIESILQRMASGVVAINTHDEITTFNPRAEEILSIDREEVLGKDLRLLPSPLGDCLFETYTTGKSYHQKEIVLPCKQIPLEVSTYRLGNGKNEILGSVMIFDDISERKQLEAERRKSDKIEVLNKFVGQLAHEIKNPMVSIQTFSELLHEKYEDESFREFFTATVRQELKRLNELVEKLIGFSSPLNYHFSEVDLHRILEEGIQLLQEQGKMENGNLDIYYYSNPLYVRADKTTLARAFSYLLNELVQISGNGKIKIETEPEHSKSMGRAFIRLKDVNSKGRYSNTEDMQKMFDPLAVNEISPESLGLPVSRKIIEDHGGSIEASLTPEKLFQFVALLPIQTWEGGEEDECWKADGSREEGE